MKNTILVSITILSVCFFFIGQTSTKKDFDAEAKYRVLERVLIKLINEKKSTDAKLEKIEAELKDWKKAYLMEIANKEIESGLTKMLDEKFPTKEKKSSPQSLDWSAEQRIKKIENQVRDLDWSLAQRIKKVAESVNDLEIDVRQHKDFFGSALGRFGLLGTLEEIQMAIHGKSDKFHSHF